MRIVFNDDRDAWELPDDPKTFSSFVNYANAATGLAGIQSDPNGSTTFDCRSVGAVIFDASALPNADRTVYFVLRNNRKTESFRLVSADFEPDVPNRPRPERAFRAWLNDPKYNPHLFQYQKENYLVVLDFRQVILIRCHLG
jgi:hypothetical protein